jgi:hypothetical protein
MTTARLLCILTLGLCAPFPVANAYPPATQAPNQVARFFVVSAQDAESTNQVFRYRVDGPGSVPCLENILTHPSFDRPIAVTFHPNGEMFVMNRGLPTPGRGSISRFLHPTGTPVFNGTIPSSGFTFSGPHWGAFRMGELFVAQRFGNNVLRFLFDASGAASFNGAITSGLGGTAPRSVSVHPTTGEVFVTECCGVNEINRYLIDASGAAIPNGVITNPGLSNTHDMAWSPWEELFVCNAGNHTISRFLFDAAGNATANGQITGNGLAVPVGLDFSPWGELFVSSVSGATVSRFTFDTSLTVPLTDPPPRGRLPSMPGGFEVTVVSSVHGGPGTPGVARPTGRRSSPCHPPRPWRSDFHRAGRRRA